MNGELDLAEVYSRRLQIIQPTRADIQRIRRIYKKQVVEDARAVIAALHALGHDVYIISGGLYQPVLEFGRHLGIRRDHIRAVEVEYNQLGARWWRHESYRWDEPYMAHRKGALTVSDGKAHIVRALRGEKTGRSLLIGDGTSDLLASRAVDLFVGYGGVVTRERVREEAPIFLKLESLAPLLVLAAGPAAVRRLRHTPHHAVFTKGLHLIAEGALEFTDERLNSKFHRAYQAVHSGTDGSPS
jgi:phosphoserine phosphatase